MYKYTFNEAALEGSSFQSTVTACVAEFNGGPDTSASPGDQATEECAHIDALKTLARVDADAAKALKPLFEQVVASEDVHDDRVISIAHTGLNYCKRHEEPGPMAA